MCSIIAGHVGQRQRKTHGDPTALVVTHSPCAIEFMFEMFAQVVDA